MSYLTGLPEPLASKVDAELLLIDTRLPVHTQIASLHSTVLAELLAGTATEAAAEGGLPAFRLAIPDSGAEEGGTPRSYDPSRRSVLTPSSLAAFLSFCYGQELGSAVGPLGRLLEVGEALGSPTLPAAVDKHLATELTQGRQQDLGGAAGLATKYRLVQAMGAILPLLSHRKPGSRRASFSDHDWEQAFDRLDAQCKRMAFTLARATPEERQEQGIGELGAAAAYCAEALKDSGWAGRRGTGTQGSPGRSPMEGIRGW